MRIAALALAIAVAFGALPAAAQYLINTTFMDSNSTGWVLSAYAGSNFTPCLTSGNAACGNDPVGQGWLRLTNATAQANGEAGVAYYNTAFAVSQGFAVDFEYVAWGGTGADGIGVILFDGSTSTVTVGAPGGSFGYAADYNTATGCTFGSTQDPGLTNGYLGLALDEYGNFEFASDRCKNGGSGAQTPDSISVRGPGNGDNSGNNYLYLAGTGTLTPGIDSPGGATRPANTTYYRHVIITVVPNTGVTPNTVTVNVSWMTSLYGSFTTVLSGTYTLPNGYVTPSTLKLGFTASTGGSTNFHEIRNVKVSYPADLAVTKTHSPASPAPGSQVTYTITTTNNGPNNVTGAVLTDPVPSGLTGVTWTCAVTGTGSCSAANGSGNSVYEVLNLNNGAHATVTVTGTLPNTTPQQQVNTATITPPTSITDSNPNNNSATDVIEIGSPPATMTISKTATSGTVATGNTETFVIVVADVGTATSTGTSVSDVLPAGFSTTGVTVSSTQGPCTFTATTRTVACALGTMSPNGTATIMITATAATTGTWNNAATVTNNEGANVTSTAAQVIVAGTVANATDLAVTKTHAGSPGPGDSVVYTMVVTNTGNSIRQTNYATFVDTLPPSLSNSVTWNCTHTGTGTCPTTLPTNRVANLQFQLNSGATMTFTATATLSTSATPPIFNTVTVTPPATWADSNPANNIATDELSFSVPVTVARFLALTEPDGVRFRWTSSIEIANAGYNLYSRTPEGLVRLNDRLIPSASPDSTVPVQYEEFVEGAPPGPYVLEDVDIRTGVRRHGPFEADRAYGAEPAAEPIDWAAVRASSREVAALAVTQAAKVQQVNILVDHDGLYRVTYEALKGAGFDLAGIPVQQLALTCRGASVPILVVGPGAALGDSPPRSFGPGVAVEFFASAVNSLYTRTNVYTLASSWRGGARIALDGTPVPAGQPPQSYLETVSVVKPLQYSAASPTGTPWYETGILAYTSPVSQTFTVPVDNLATGGSGARFSFHMWGGTDWPDFTPDHHAVLDLDGHTVADDSFDGVTDHPISGPLPDGALVEGANTFTLTLPGDSGVDYEIVNVTSYGLTYPRRFVARNGALSFTSGGGVFAVDGLPSSNVEVYRIGGSAPRRLTQVQTQPSGSALLARFAGTGQTASYAVYDASAISAPTFAPVPQPNQIKNGYADYLIIAHPNFIAGLDPLVRARTAQGLRVKVVNVNDVYAAFNYGIVDPQAIHDYIAYAYRSMRTRYVLLVGGDTYDYFDYLHTGSISFVPTPYAPTGDLVLYAPADPLLADATGDGVPDLALGRLPVRTPAELATVIAKTLAYRGRGASSRRTRPTTATRSRP